MELYYFTSIFNFLSDFRTGTLTNKCVSCAIVGTAAWFAMILGLRYTLKGLLSYQGWMFQPHGRVSKATKMWFVSIINREEPNLFVQMLFFSVFGICLVLRKHFHWIF